MTNNEPIDESFSQTQTPLSAFNEVDKLREKVEFLWKLLDDIDTVTDMSKDNSGAYRSMVKYILQKRHTVVTSDAYNLFVVSKN